MDDATYLYLLQSQQNLAVQEAFMHWH